MYDVYPRPLLRRKQWESLNGEWILNGRPVNVPYPPQSPLSGWNGEVPDRLVYEKEVPIEYPGPGYRVLLNFGAVDQRARVLINGKEAGYHEGGYLPFSMDITDLITDGKNTVTVEAEDTLSHFYPYGKQTKRPGGMWYTPVSGIWQTVWTETVPEDHVTQIRTDADTETVRWKVSTSSGSGCRITVSDQEGPVFSSDSPEGSIEVPFDRRRLWSPEDPFLYDVKVATPGGDEVSSYLALRRISSEIIDGVPRICLNGKPVFLNGVLDQGYYPEGLFLPGDASAYRSDILRMKEMGFNTLRKHIKIEPEIFYYECDRMGMLVVQDMVNSGDYSFLRDTVLPTVGIKRRNDRKKNGEREEFFLSHMRQTAAHLHGHPCIIAYTIFNEGWGQFNSDEAYDILKAEEPDRLIDTTSGWFAGSRSDFDSEHIYFRTKKLRPGVRPMLLSECGGFVFDADPQTKKGPVWGYGRCRSSQELTARIVDMYRRMVLPAVGKGLCGCIFTQLSDVENELNGLVTYDRTFVKADPDALKKISDEILMELNS